jgi:predicted component of viral defense system (DUF524 family)
MQSVSETCTFIQSIIQDSIQNLKLGPLYVLPTTEAHNFHIPFTRNNQIKTEETVVHKKCHKHFLLQHLTLLNEVSALVYYRENASEHREQLKFIGSLHNYTSHIHTAILPMVKPKSTSIIKREICRSLYLYYFIIATAIRQCLVY